MIIIIYGVVRRASLLRVFGGVFSVNIKSHALREPQIARVTASRNNSLGTIYHLNIMNFCTGVSEDWCE